MWSFPSFRFTPLFMERVITMKKLILLLALICSPIFASPKVVVTYFMSTYRCHSCHYIENMTRETLLIKFRDEMGDSSIVFKVLNIDDEENSHFITKYELETKSVVVSKMSGDEELSWERLDILWKHIDDDTGFSEIVSNAIIDIQKEEN
jgi:hypothetical protein